MWLAKVLCSCCVTTWFSQPHTEGVLALPAFLCDRFMYGPNGRHTIDHAPALDGPHLEPTRLRVYPCRHVVSGLYHWSSSHRDMHLQSLILRFLAAHSTTCMQLDQALSGLTVLRIDLFARQIILAQSRTLNTRISNAALPRCNISE